MPNKYAEQKILIVDDTPADIAILKDLLISDCKICVASKGEEAIGILKADDLPDLILLDIILPDMDGYEICRYIKTDPLTRNIPIIFITVKDNCQDEAFGLELGAVDYITKPFFLPIVSARIRTHLELKRHRDVLERLSSLDGLTGIPNRRRFEECLIQEWRNAIREQTPLSLIMIDIDFFKAFNDHYGHCAGDECLKQVAAALSVSMRRPRDFVARYGGEEFAVILPNTDAQGVMFMAKSLRSQIESLSIPHEYSVTASHITISQGAASVNPSKDFSHHDLVEAADQALYRAKFEGRNRINYAQLNSQLNHEVQDVIRSHSNAQDIDRR